MDVINQQKNGKNYRNTGLLNDLQLANTLQLSEFSKMRRRVKMRRIQHYCCDLGITVRMLCFEFGHTLELSIAVDIAEKIACVSEWCLILFLRFL